MLGGVAPDASRVLSDRRGAYEKGFGTAPESFFAFVAGKNTKAAVWDCSEQEKCVTIKIQQFALLYRAAGHVPASPL